ncbi:MAG: DNA polymerase III subunit beta [Candidatus Paceibacterota bacterium]|jgi:DNA polymerase-3 subunit beta
MNIIALKNNIKEGLNAISGARKESSNLPVLKNFLFETFDGKLKISSTDLEIGISYFIPAKVIKDGSLAIPFLVFSQIINNLSLERISLESKGNNLLVATDNFKAKISTNSKDDFPIIPEAEEKKDNFFIFDSDYFIDSLSSVSCACQVSDIRPELGGILFSFKDGLFKLAATDSFRLAQKVFSEKKIETKHEKDESFIVPIKTVQEIIRIFSSKKGEKIKMVFEENQVLFKTDQVRISSRLIEGKFPDYETVIPNDFETECLFDKDDVISALKLTSSLSNRLNEIRFVVDESLKNIKALSSSNDFGESEYILPAKIKGSKTQITFNWKFLLDGFRNIKTTNVFFGFNGENKASLIKTPDDNSYFYIVMPIKSS